MDLLSTTLFGTLNGPPKMALLINKFPGQSLLETENPSNHIENKLFPTQKEKSEPEVDVLNYKSIKPQVLIPPPSILRPSQ